MIYRAIIFSLFICAKLFAQDSIFKRDLSVICAKVEEITENTISYKRCEVLDGPLYISKIEDIYKIKYKNGSIDTFHVKLSKTKPAEIKISNPNYNNTNSQQIHKSYRRNTYKYQSMPISYKTIFMMSFEKNRIWNDRELSKEILMAKDCQKKQYYYGFGGPALALVGLVGISRMQFNTNNNAYAGVAIFFGSAGVFIASQIISKVYKKQRLKHTEKVVDLYNSHF
jgi:hypothetical protein